MASPYLKDAFLPEVYARLLAYIEAQRAKPSNPSYDSSHAYSAYINELGTAGGFPRVIFMHVNAHQLIDCIGPPDSPLRLLWNSLVAQLDTANANILADFAAAEVHREAMLKD